MLARGRAQIWFDFDMVDDSEDYLACLMQMQLHLPGQGRNSLKTLAACLCLRFAEPVAWAKVSLSLSAKIDSLLETKVS